MLWCLLSVVSLVGGLYVEFEVHHAFRSPNGVDRLVVVVNGEFPGPTLTLHHGERLQVKVTNRLPTQGLAMHWHGLQQRGTPYADGVAWVTQYPIHPRQSYIYDMVATTGTHYYHAHHGALQADGVLGAIIVHPNIPEPFPYDEELLLMLMDWWKEPSDVKLAGLALSDSEGGFRWVGEPHSILHNGKAPCLQGYTGCPLHQWNVTSGRRYRLRIIGGMALSHVNVMISGHPVTIVEADGVYTEPYVVSSVDVNAGQRWSVVLDTRGHTPGNYWVNTETRYRDIVTGQAILHYTEALDELPNLPIPTNPFTELMPTKGEHHHHHFNATALLNWNPSKLKTHPDVYRMYPGIGGPEGVVGGPPSQVTRTLLLDGYQVKVGGRMAWVVNDVIYDDADRPILSHVREACASKTVHTDTCTSDQPSSCRDDAAGPGEGGWSKCISSLYPLPTHQYARVPHVIPLLYGEVVDVVLMNHRELNHVCEQHPWHLHGHSFWIMERGVGMYNGKGGGTPIERPLFRDSTTVYPHSWVRLRFVADNPGAWLFHCHVVWHMGMGMQLLFVTTPGIPNVPDTIRKEEGGQCSTNDGTSHHVTLNFAGLFGGLDP